MRPSLLQVAVTQPDLLIDHAEAYAELIDAEIINFRTVYGRRAWLGASRLFLLAMGLMLSGVAVMLYAVSPQPDQKALWILIATPAVPVALAWACHTALQKPVALPFDSLRRQIKTDIQMLRGFNSK